MQIYTLTEIMCQRGEKPFCEVLNRLRTDDLTEEDNAVFESCMVKKTFSLFARGLSLLPTQNNSEKSQ